VEAMDIRRENGVGEGKEGEVEVPYLLARPSNVFNHKNCGVNYTNQSFCFIVLYRFL
jgi:hypothetical protein